MDPRHRQLVELSIEDAADVLEISSSMVQGALTAARVSLLIGAI
jgi:predicted DNA-binding protein (UPF0251 family)